MEIGAHGITCNGHLSSCFLSPHVAATRALYLDDKYFAELECKTKLEHGTCPPTHSAIYVYAREYESSDELLAKIRQKIVKQTHGCYDVSDLHLTPQSTSTRHEVCVSHCYVVLTSNVFITVTVYTHVDTC